MRTSFLTLFAFTVLGVTVHAFSVHSKAFTKVQTIPTELTIQLALPENQKLNPLAVSKVSITTLQNGEEIDSVKNVPITTTDFTVTVGTPPTPYTVALDATVYFCGKEKGSLCYVREVKVTGIPQGPEKKVVLPVALQE